MFDTGDRQRSRNTFVGTPCWMAPEVMQQLHGYDFKADIWSFGITALELAHGHAPFSKYPPMKVLLMTLQNAPPGLDYERDKRFSKSFKDLVGNCLVKDPKKRPSSEKIMKHPFFKHARSNDYLTRTILDGLPPLGQRFRALKDKEAELLLQNKQLGDKEHLSQQEYIRGISAWNFNLEDLKTQAALIQDPGGISNTDDSDTNKKHNDDEEDFASKLTSSEKDEFHDLQTVEGSLASTFPVHSLQALKGCFDVFEGEEDATSPNLKKPDTESMFQLQSSSQVENSDSRLNNGVVLERKLSSAKNVSAPGQHPRFLSGPLISESGVSSKKVVGDGERGEMPQKNQSEGNYSGTLFYHQMKEPIAANTHELEEGAEGRYVQHKGRFKVTSADINAKGTSTTNCSANTGASTNSTITPASILPSLQYMLQQNNMQREQIIKLIRSMEQMSGQNMELSDARSSDLLQVPATSRERELQTYMATLQQSIWNLVEELHRMKIRNTQLEQQLNNLTNKENDKLQNNDKETSQ
ncbi:Calcium-dependent protein kinase 8 [Acorus calamus]|uniref:Calcium-dependent protein kinase 8 n=1 Tax=Acorus calamus TaxID=4465 RepID=A0AAV9FV05_ACOCL|nr:Calcium-dependent protein kinase 8 [Acorus calamus]